MSCSCYLSSNGCYHIPPDHVPARATQISPLGKVGVHVVMFIAATGANTAWNAFAFAMVPFQSQFSSLALGRYFWIIALLLYNIPGLPVQMLQSRYDAMMVTVLGIRETVLLRNALTLLPLAIVISLFPLAVMPWDGLGAVFIMLLLGCAVVGMLQAAAFGWTMQLASYFPAEQGFNTRECSLAGMGFATLLLLAITLWTGFDAATVSEDELVWYFIRASVVIGASFAAQIVLLFIPGVREILVDEQKMVRRRALREHILAGYDEDDGASDESEDGELEMEALRGDSEEIRVDDVESDAANDESESVEMSGDGCASVGPCQGKCSGVGESCCQGECHCRERSIEHARKTIRSPAQLLRVMKVSLITTSLAALSLISLSACIPYIPSSRDSTTFTATLMYAQAISVFFGNMLAMCTDSLKHRARAVLAMDLSRLPILLVFMVYAGWNVALSDVIMFVLVVLFGASGSFLNSVSYQMVEVAVEPHECSVAMRLLNVALYANYEIGAAVALIVPVLRAR